MVQFYRSLLLIAFVSSVLVFSTTNLNAQTGFGVRFGQLKPFGSFSYTYKHSLSIEAFYSPEVFDNDRIRFIIGLGYSKLFPKLDTFRIAEYSPYFDEVHPGYQVFSNSSIAYGFFDFNYALFEYKKFTFYTGMGVSAGVFTTTLSESVEKSYSGNEVKAQPLIMGFRSSVSINYAINNNLEVFAQAINHVFRGGDGSGDGSISSDVTIGYNTFNIGILYGINQEDY